jgi:hypothetical protein
MTLEELFSYAKLLGIFLHCFSVQQMLQYLKIAVENPTQWLRKQSEAWFVFRGTLSNTNAVPRKADTRILLHRCALESFGAYRKVFILPLSAISISSFARLVSSIILYALRVLGNIVCYYCCESGSKIGLHEKDDLKYTTKCSSSSPSASPPRAQSSPTSCPHPLPLKVSSLLRPLTVPRVHNDMGFLTPAVHDPPSCLCPSFHTAYPVKHHQYPELGDQLVHILGHHIESAEFGVRGCSSVKVGCYEWRAEILWVAVNFPSLWLVSSVFGLLL